LPWYNAKPWAYDELKRVYRLREDNDHDAIRPGILFYDFNLQAFHVLRAKHGFGDCSESLIEWMDFLSGADKKSREEIALVKSPILQKAYSIIDDLPMDVEEQAEEFLKRQYNISHFVGEKMKEAAKEAKEEGKIETAKNFLLMGTGLTLEQIANGSGLSVSEVERIALELKSK
jgi:predicted transposase/invertase (TIGR01784 family)